MLDSLLILPQLLEIKGLVVVDAYSKLLYFKAVEKKLGWPNGYLLLFLNRGRKRARDQVKATALLIIYKQSFPLESLGCSLPQRFYEKFPSDATTRRFINL